LHGRSVGREGWSKPGAGSDANGAGAIGSASGIIKRDARSCCATLPTSRWWSMTGLGAPVDMRQRALEMARTRCAQHRDRKGADPSRWQRDFASPSTPAASI